MFGFSVYLQQPMDVPYMENMVASGFTGIFTSILIPEDDADQYTDRVRQLGEFVKKEQIDLTVDISNQSLEKIGGSFTDLEAIRDLGISRLRIDDGISMADVAKISKEIQIALNASTITEADIQELQNHQAVFDNISAWHNFYPRPETGLDAKYFASQNQWLQSIGFTTMAFVPGDEEKRGPLYKGLPTLEDHRESHPLLAGLDLLQNHFIQDVYIGDSKLSKEGMGQFKPLIDGDGIVLHAKPIEGTPKGLLDIVEGVHTNRQDAAKYVLRSRDARINNQLERISPMNNIHRCVGAVTIDNEVYGRYMGEIQIAKVPLAMDEKVNVVAQVIEEDLPIIQAIGPGQVFEIIMEE